MGIKNQRRTGDMSWAWGAWDERWACLKMVHPMGHRHTKGNMMRNHMLGSVVFWLRQTQIVYKYKYMCHYLLCALPS